MIVLIRLVKVMISDKKGCCCFMQVTKKSLVDLDEDDVKINKDNEKKVSLDDLVIMNCQDRWKLGWWLTLVMAELGYLIFMAACSVIVAISQIVFFIYSAAWILVSLLVLYEIKWIAESQVKRLLLKQGRLKHGRVGEGGE